MSRHSDARSFTESEVTPDDPLFKPDRPRHIDRFIDYFGATNAQLAGDPCGEAFLDTIEDEA